ncbi:MAG: hypothetical protein R3308_11095 [Thiohalobacterales bacterium]|nr:hypothetical protein [Thiohalobacterales bacterium]
MPDTVMTAPVRIIGIGSATGVDALGRAAIERLRKSRWAAHHPAGLVDIAACPAPALLPARVRGPGLLVLIDALPDDGAPGRVRQLSVEELASAPETSSHGMGIREAVALIEALEGDALKTIVLGISCGASDDVADIDALLDAAWPALPEILDGLIAPLPATARESLVN